MLQVNQESSKQQVDSAQKNAVEPIPAARERVDYMNMIPDGAWVYSVERDTVMLDDWENHTLCLMKTAQILEYYQVSIAKIKQKPL